MVRAPQLPSAAPTPSCFSPASVWALSKGFSHSEEACSCVGFSQVTVAIRRTRFCAGFPTGHSGFGIHRAVPHSLFPFAVFKCFFTQTPPALLMGSAVPCRRFIGASCDQHMATLGHLPHSTDQFSTSRKQSAC